MKIINDFPPNVEEIRKVFKFGKNTVFAYDDNIYNPSGIFIDPSLLEHEKTHLLQQQNCGVDRWWKRYLTERAFRASQEIPAYQNQYNELKKHIKDRNKLFRYVVELAKDLSGETYGNLMTFNEALEIIREKDLITFRT